MAIVATLEDAFKQIGLANARSFKIVKGTKDSTNTIYPYNDEISLDDNIEAARKAMSTEIGNQYTILTYKANAARSTSQKTFSMQDNAEQYGIGGFPAQQPAVAAAASEESIQRMIDAAVSSVRNEYDRKEIERMRHDLDEERREFQRKEESFIGVLVNKFAPVIDRYVDHISGGRRGGLAVAGIESDETGDDDMMNVTEADIDAADEALEDLLTRWANADEDWRVLLEKVVALAESKAPMYTMAKQMLMK